MSDKYQDVFQHSTVWKRYFRYQMWTYLSGHVLEVGAGIGGTTAVLCSNKIKWFCVEPNEDNYNRLDHQYKMHGTITDVKGEYDTVLYVDVLEHIHDDKREIQEAGQRLRIGGNLIILVPAHQFLFSGFDAAIGHYRRYNKCSLLTCLPAGFIVKRLRYLDSCGMLASIANKLIHDDKMPTVGQVLFWDRVIVPCSIVLDALTGYTLGKSVLMVATKDGGAE